MRSIRRGRPDSDGVSVEPDSPTLPAPPKSQTRAGKLLAEARQSTTEPEPNGHDDPGNRILENDDFIEAQQHASRLTLSDLRRALVINKGTLARLASMTEIIETEIQIRMDEERKAAMEMAQFQMTQFTQAHNHGQDMPDPKRGGRA